MFFYLSMYICVYLFTHLFVHMAIQLFQNYFLKKVVYFTALPGIFDKSQ